MNIKDIYAIISRYLTKTTVDKDEKILNTWINESDENKSLFEIVENHWNSPGQRKFSILKSEEVKKDIWERANKQQLYVSGLERKRRFREFLKYAAAILFLVISIPIVYLLIDRGSSQQLSANLISKSNNAGRKSNIHLKDGTIVNLNSESEITYYETFSDTARIIWLTGEAFFEVAHDREKPFYVISQNVKVKALGTSFNVFGYADSDKVKVSLSSGKVSVGKYSATVGEDLLNEIEILPGQEISYQKSQNVFSPITTYDAIEVEGWKDGILYFKQAGLSEIVSKLKRWYGVDIQLNSVPKNEISYTGKFKNQNLENVLMSIGFVTNFNFEINEKNVLLNFKTNEYE